MIGFQRGRNDQLFGNILQFDELIEMVTEEEMPLPSYTWTHKDAKLTEEQRQSIIKWAEQVRFKYSLAPKPE